MKTILVVDDNASVLNLVRQILEDLGYTVHTAEDWFIAGRLSSLNTYDLFISDNQLGEKRSHWGVNLIPRLKRHQPEAGSILMSSEQVDDHPADLFILKPFNHDTLQNAVESLLNTKS